MKYLNFKTKILLVGLALLVVGTTNNATAATQSSVDFAGHTWTVRGGTGGPGANNGIGNYWGNTDQDVFVDGSGYLHLKVSQHADDPDTEEDDPNRWYSSEVYLEDSLGYGKYTFDINSRLDLIDRNLVAAPFLYQDDEHEIDIEHSYWSEETAEENLFYNVQPYSIDGNQQSIAATFSDGVFQDVIDWQPDKIQFSTIQNGVEVNSWTYTGANNFVPGEEEVHINFWQYNSLPPINNTTNELIVSGFTFEPYEAPSSTPTSTTSTPSETATTSINLSVQTSQESFEFLNLTVTACPETDGSTTSTLNAMCALKQSPLTTSWTTWGSDMFLDSVNSYANDFVNNIYWGWFENLNFGEVALNKHILTPNENLLLTYDVLPLKISIETTTPVAGTTSTITLEKFGFESYPPIWSPAGSSTFYINGTAFTDDDGVYDLVITSTDEIVVFGTKPGFITSSILTINPVDGSTPTTTTSTGGGGSGGGSSTTTNTTVSDNDISNAVTKLINFIKSNQGADGKVVDAGTSDWVAMTFGAKDIYAADVKNSSSSLNSYLYNYDISLLESELNNCAAFPRHIMGLLASGVSKTDQKVLTLKTKLDGCVQGGNFGQNGINDDVFGLIAAIAIGEDQSSLTVQTTLSAIKANQQADGGFAYPGPFESPDLTGAAINALKYAQENGADVEMEIFTKAKQYLKAQQLADGGWGYFTSDALTTSWAVMGINALGEDQSDWFNANGKNPWYVLTTLDNDHFTQSWDSNVDWFGTKSAVPALLGKSWPIILDPKDETSGGNGGTPINQPTSTQTTTTIATTTTSTIEMATTTPTTTIAVEPEILPVVLTLAPTTLPINQNSQTQTNSTNNSANTAPTPEMTQEMTSGEKLESETSPIDSLPLDTPTRRAVKKALAVTGGGAVAVGFWLGFRFLKNVL